MSKVKRTVVSVLVIASMAFGLASCGGSGDKEKFVGTWNTNVDLTDFVNEQVQAGLDAVGADAAEYFNLGEFGFMLDFTFNSDDTYSIAVDEDSLNSSVESVKNSFKDGFTAYVENMITTTGVDMTVDEMLALSGTSMDEVVDAGFSDEIINGMIEEFEINGKWDARDGKLYTSESVNADIDESSYDLYEINGDSIKLSLPEGQEDELGVFPLVLKKAA